MENLTFAKDESGKYIASFVTTNNSTAVQLVLESAGDVVFSASIGNYNPVALGGVTKLEGNTNVLRWVEVPTGVKITIVSDVPVLSGGYV